MYKSNIRIDDGKVSSIFKRNFLSTNVHDLRWISSLSGRQITFLERVHHEPDRCWVGVILFNGTFDDEARVTFVWRIMASVVWTIVCSGSIDVENRRNGVDVRIFLSLDFVVWFAEF